MLLREEKIEKAEKNFWVREANFELREPKNWGTGKKKSLTGKHFLLKIFMFFDIY